jgi:hypothetical protein
MNWTSRRLLKLWLVIASLGSLLPSISLASAEVREFLPERAGYYDTVWPSEHTDLWRSHAVLSAGLPAEFDESRLAISTVSLNLPTWGYTRNRNEVYVIGGSPVSLNYFTQSIKKGQCLSEQEFLQSLENDLSDPSTPYVAKLRPDAMRMARKVSLDQGWTVNYTGGLLMHQNGYIYAVSKSVLYKIDPSLRIVKSIDLPLVGDGDEEVAFWTTYNGLQVIGSGRLILKGISLTDSGDVPGWLLQIDPDDLSIKVKQKALVSTARMTIEQTANGHSRLYHPNTTESLRFEITEEAFKRDDKWTRTYRTDTDGSTPASSPLLLGEVEQIVFANDTLPCPTDDGIKLFSQPVSTEAPPDELTPVPAFGQGDPGFNFYMVAADPFLTQTVVYYDPINNLIAAHRVAEDGSLTRLWEQSGIKSSASPAISPDRDLLYMDDYRDGHDELVALRLSTGEELTRIPLDATLPTIGTIFLGMNDDV